MTREEAEKLALEKYPNTQEAMFRLSTVVNPVNIVQSAYIEGLLAGFEKGVRESAEVVHVLRTDDSGEEQIDDSFYTDDYIYTVDKESILQLLNQEKSV